MLNKTTKFIFESQLAALIDAGAILTVYLIEDGDGEFHVVARSVNHIDHRLIKKRGGHRTFKTLDAAARLIRGLGIAKMTVHMLEYAPGNAPLLR